jgi:hypothetical protein
VTAPARATAAAATGASPLRAALATTGAMLDCARSGQWEAVVALAPRHAQVIGRLRAEGGSLQDPDARADLERLEAMTRELTGLVAGGRDGLQGALRELQRGRRAARAYAGR